MKAYDEKAPCGLCSRPLGSEMIDWHHLIPKTFGGKVQVPIHKVCHRKIHSLFTERELQKKFFTFDALLQNEDIQTFVAWIKNKPLGFYISTSDSNRKKK